MIISLKRAINLINSTIQLHNSNHILPYFFIVGAGISAPEIPLSREIVQLCKREIKGRDKAYFDYCVEEMQQYETNAAKSYSGWIERAYPNSVDRSRFFKKIITKARISSANLMLANILYSQKIATTVFTTNFDDKLKQALELVGVTDLFIAENAMDNLVINPQNEGIQVIHVHGTYNFYDCANLENEIISVANQNNTISSSRVLSNFLMNQAPIIVGYSGWENDVIMTCLKERLSYKTPLTYIWVCYSKEDYNALPQWLQNSESVVFVIPETIDIGCSDDIVGNQFLQKEEQIKKNKLEATTFFNSLILSIKLNVPEIFENPFSYYSKRIAKVLPQNEDVLHLRHWAARLRILGSLDSPFEMLIKKLEHADITNDIDSAICILKEIVNLDLPIADVRFTCESLISGLLEKENVFDNIEVKIEFRMVVLDFVEKNYDELLKEDILHNCLENVFLSQCRCVDGDVYASLLDRIYTIAQKDQSTLDVQLQALGIKSEITNDSQRKISLLNNVIELSAENLDNPSIRYFHCISLYELARFLPEEEAIDIIESADKIIDNDDTTRLQLVALRAKSAAFHKVSNIELQIKWINEILHWIESNLKSVTSCFILHIASNFYGTDRHLVKETSGMIDILSKVYEKYKSWDFSYCEHAFWMLKICVTLSVFLDDARQKAFYYNEFKSFGEKVPLECSQGLRRVALGIYCELPTIIIPDQLKIEEIQQYKTKYPDDQNSIIDALSIARKVGDVRVYDKCSGLEENEYFLKSNILSDGYNAYLSKDFEQAERLFVSLINCGFDYVECVARNNLSFMIRRKETISTDRQFWDVINSIPNDYVFKHMNTVLYCVTEGIENDLRYNSSIDYLKMMTLKDEESIYECWTNINLVGETESQLALKILAEIKAKKQSC